MELQDIVRRLRMKQSIKAIKRETGGKHRRVIRRVIELAGQEGWLDAERELPSEHQLQKIYHEQRGGEDGRCHPPDARPDQIEGWREDGYSFLVIHKLLQERGVEYSETTVRRYIHRHFPPPVRPVMRRETKPGEVMEVDFGHLGLTWDAATRSRRRTWVFSGRLRHCRRAYREVVFDHKQQTFFACHMHAFEWFGGGHRRVVRGPVGEPRLARARTALRVPDFALSAAPSRTQRRRRGRYQVRQAQLPAAVPRSPEGARARDSRCRRAGGGTGSLEP